MAAREQVMAALAQHRWEFHPDESDPRNVRFGYVSRGLWRCGCGWRVPREEFNPEAHERHLADVLAHLMVEDPQDPPDISWVAMETARTPGALWYALATLGTILAAAGLVVVVALLALAIAGAIR